MCEVYRTDARQQCRVNINFNMFWDAREGNSAVIHYGPASMFGNETHTQIMVQQASLSKQHLSMIYPKECKQLDQRW